MPLWCRLRLTWSTFRFRSRDACMTKLGIMTDENTTSQQTQPTEAATEAAAETATDTDAQQQDQGAQSAAESAAPVDFEPLTATYERLRHSTDPAELSEFARRPLPDRADQAAFSRATALLEAVAGNPHTPVADRVFLADTMPFPNVLVKLSEDPEPSVRQAVAANGDDKNWLVGRLTKDPVPAVRDTALKNKRTSWKMRVGADVSVRPLEAAVLQKSSANSDAAAHLTVGADAGHSRSRRRSVTDVGLPLAGTHRPGRMHRFYGILRQICNFPTGRCGHRPLQTNA